MSAEAGDGVLEGGVLADGAVDQAAAGTDLHALADGGAALEDRAGEEGDVGGQAHGGVDVGGGRVDHGDALGQPLGVGARAQLGLGVGELGPVVDAVGLVGVGGDHAHDAVAGVGQHLHDVGEVVLALGVVGLHHAQRRRQQAAPEAEDAGVDLVDLELVGGGVAVLDDAGDALVLAHAHDAAVAGGVVEPGGEDRARGAGAAVLGHQLGDRAGPAAAACRPGSTSTSR